VLLLLLLRFGAVLRVELVVLSFVVLSLRCCLNSWSFISLFPPSVVMAVEKEKLQEESVIRRFYQIILSWDYFALLKEFKAIHFTPYSFSFVSVFFLFCIRHVFLEFCVFRSRGTARKKGLRSCRHS